MALKFVFLVLNLTILVTIKISALTSVFQFQQKGVAQAPIHAEKPYPRLTARFSMNWTIYYNTLETPIPPYDKAPPPPYELGRGYSYYDNYLPGMIEHFLDSCLPIFAGDYHWPCIFFNRLSTTYLISPEWAPYGPCCIYRKPWWPPTQSFLKVVPFNRTEVYHNKIIDWFVLGGPNPAPFGYGFYWDKTPSGTRVPGAFWFRGNKGWLNQDFFNFTDQVVKTFDFKLPKQCVNASFCLFVP